MAILHRLVAMESIGFHSRQRLGLPFNVDHFRHLGAKRLSTVKDEGHLPANSTVLEVEPSEGNSQVPAGFYELPGAFSEKKLEEIAIWLVSC